MPSPQAPTPQHIRDRAIGLNPLERSVAFLPSIFNHDTTDLTIDTTGSFSSRDNTLFGGRGDHSFVISDGVDAVLDFTQGQDIIDASDVDDAIAGSFVDIIARATQVGQDTVFDFGEGNVTTLDNVQLSRLSASDFIFDVPDAQQPLADCQAAS